MLTTDSEIRQAFPIDKRTFHAHDKVWVIEVKAAEFESRDNAQRVLIHVILRPGTDWDQGIAQTVIVPTSYLVEKGSDVAAATVDAIRDAFVADPGSGTLRLS